MNTLQESHLGKRVLLRPADLVSSKDINEVRILEFSPSKERVKIMHPSKGTSFWSEILGWELLEELPDKSIIEELQVAYGVEHQRVARLEAEKAEWDKAVETINRNMETTKKSVLDISKLLDEQKLATAKAQDECLAKEKEIFLLKEKLMVTERELEREKQRPKQTPVKP